MGFGEDIAVVGMAVQVPGALSLDAYWQNLREGRESIRGLSETELLDAGESLERIRRANYVKAAATLDGYDTFDADFFGFSPKEAAILDPQHRKFLEVSWEALENAGHPPETVAGKVGVYAGCGMGSYFYFNICSNPDLVDDVGMFLLRHTGNDKDFLSTRVSHVFDLKGPSLNIQTACSTSLVAVHYAAKALKDGECDMAIAGGATLELPHGRGYLFKENEILSPDGHCHAFDHRAQGTVFGSGAGAVVLRRLSDALADGDHIWAVLKGSAVNNDGAAKAGYLAPSVAGQAEAVAQAHKAAGITSDTVGYVECHGTGTYLGDPIEISALTEAFRQTSQGKGFCRIGSVKTNIGHLDTAAGVAGLVKTSLALHHGEVPPNLGFEAPNPVIDFDASPFRVNDRLAPWTADTPRRAGVNSLGVGGTNAHVVLEQAPEPAPQEESDWPFQLLTVSGRSKAALDANSDALAAHLRAHPEQPLADVAFTLKEGRRGFEHRRVVVAGSHDEAADLLQIRDPGRVFSHKVVRDDPDVTFMFPGGGAQFPGMARDLYETEPVFREWMDRGLDHLAPQLSYDIRALWLAEGEDIAEAAKSLKQPSVQLPLIMITEYALAQLWQSWGVRPAALVGHSMGENTAACLAGVMSFEDCIDLVLLRGRLFDSVPRGGMLSIPLSAEALAPMLGEDLDIAALNAPDLTAVSGPQASLDRLQAQLAAKDIECQRIAIDIAAHSRMLEPILPQFRTFLEGLELRAPSLPFLSNRTGDWITDAQATDPGYWVDHLRHAVRFSDCVATLAARPDRVWLEVGPGKALSSLAQMHTEVAPNQVLSSLRHPDQSIADDLHFVGVLGRLWATGVDIDWGQIWGGAKRRRVPLPTYAFQRSRYFIAPGAGQAEKTAPLVRQKDMRDWGYVPRWQKQLAECDLDPETGITGQPPMNWLIFNDKTGPAAEIAGDLRGAGHRVVEVRLGDTFARLADDIYVLSPEQGREGYELLIRDLAQNGGLPDRIGHFWLLTQDETHRPGSSFFDRNQECGFYSLWHLAAALADADTATPPHILVVTNGAARVRGEALPFPEKATVAGPCGVIPREFPGLTCSTLDIDLQASPAPTAGWPFLRRRRSADGPSETLKQRLIEDLFAKPANGAAAYRGKDRFALTYAPAKLDAVQAGSVEPFRQDGVFMITGGLGGIGLSVAEMLIRDANARLVLVTQGPFPEKPEWQAYLRRRGPLDKTSRRIRALERLEALGGEIMVVSADVCDLDQMTQAVAVARDRFGEINGVIHAAGAIDDAPMLAKTAASAQAVLAPKIQGTRVLDAIFADGTLDQLVLFSSTSTVTRPAGQLDYVAANAFLNAYAQSRADDATRVVAVNWGVWSEVGMAAHSVAASTGSSEEMPEEFAGQPLLATATHDRNGNRVFKTSLSAASHWILDEHRTADNVAVLPGTGYLELAAQALAAQGQTGGFEIRNLSFLRPFDVDGDEPKELRVRLLCDEEGYGLETLASCTVDGKHGHQLTARGVLRPEETGPAPWPTLDLSAISARTNQKAAAGEPKSPQDAHLKFGPRWRVLRSTRHGDGEGLAQLALPDPARADLTDGYLLHPALMDLATGWALDLAPGYDDADLWVPAAYRRVRVLKPLPTEIFSWVRLSTSAPGDQSLAEFDVTITDGSGAVCVDIEGFTMTRIDARRGFAKKAGPDRADIEFENEADAPLSATQGEERLAYLVSQGIGPDQGPEALVRALSLGKPQVVVSSLDLVALQQQADRDAAATKTAEQGFDRPDVDTEFVEPATDIERMLATFWQDLLGLTRVGADDNFFDLGGHSLIAVRLFSKVRKTYGVDFPLSVLFEAPTIAGLAALIAGKTDASSTSPAPTALQPRRFDHLVAMHEDEGGPGTPFFMVAGMFGNVLNLRHLAQIVGRDRPFYGVQARGLFGDAEPHRQTEAAARDYIAEIRQVQPTGPYLLGGFSGGGITAYEMAQQLAAAGEEVSTLVMLDTPLPVRPGLTSIDKLLIKLHELRKKGPVFLREWLASRINWEIEKRRFAPTVQAGSEQFHDRDIEAAFREAVALYQLRPWPGPLTLYRPALDRHWKVSRGRWVSREREYVFADNQWSDWAPEIDVQEVPGDHDSMVLEPNVRVLARKLAACLAEAEPAPSKQETEPAQWLPATAAE